MYAVNFFIFIFLHFFQKVLTQSPLDQFNITQLIGMCVPSALAVQVESISQIQLQKGCQSLTLPYPEMLELRCCELEYQKKNNDSAPRYHGCMSFLSNYIDNDRYEDIIDWIERGKFDKFNYYNIFLGQTVYNMSVLFPLVENETKYEVFKLDCLSEYIFHKYYSFFIFAIFFI